VGAVFLPGKKIGLASKPPSGGLASQAKENNAWNFFSRSSRHGGCFANGRTGNAARTTCTAHASHASHAGHPHHASLKAPELALELTGHTGHTALKAEEHTTLTAAKTRRGSLHASGKATTRHTRHARKASTKAPRLKTARLKAADPTHLAARRNSRGGRSPARATGSTTGFLGGNAIHDPKAYRCRQANQHNHPEE
jgi:hypothetical protein